MRMRFLVACPSATISTKRFWIPLKEKRTDKKLSEDKSDTATDYAQEPSTGKKEQIAENNGRQRKSDRVGDRWTDRQRDLEIGSCAIACCR